MARKHAGHFKSLEEAVLHGLRESMAIIFSGRRHLLDTGEVTSAVGREVMKDMEAAEARARKCLEALDKLIR